MNILPIDPLLPEMLALLERERRLVLVAPPGAGKTTRVPPAIVRAIGSAQGQTQVILLQPRRVAARAAAARIAEERGWTLGDEVGYQVRFERRARPSTRLLVATEGILNRRLVGDPCLEGVGAVVLDEFHERSLHTDLALALLREIQQTVREDLRIVVMSATLEAEPVARYLGGCPIVRAEGRLYPVAIEYHPAPSAVPLPQRVAAAVTQALAAPLTGHLLVFLPGWQEIERTARLIGPIADREGLLVLPLHGRLSGEAQDRALRPADRRKLILATNVAETSLTIDGVRTVIDSGLARYASHDSARGLDRLVLGRISRASAEQRAGRAGRTGPGVCLRLWSQREDRGLAPFDEPEVRRVDLAETVLALHAAGHSNPDRFPWFERPPAEALAAADRLLAMLGAIAQEGGPISPLGRQLLSLPVHPRLGRLLLAAAEKGLLHQGAALAALLSEKDLMYAHDHFDESVRPRGPKAAGSSDLLVRLDALAEAEGVRFASQLRVRGIDPAAAKQVARTRDDLIRLGQRLPMNRNPEPMCEPEEEVLLKLVLLAYPDRLARRRAPRSDTGVMVGGRGVRLEHESVVREAELFLALDPRDVRRGDKREARVRIASAVCLEWLAELFPNSFRTERKVEFDEERQRALAIQTIWYRDLLLREDRNAAVDTAEASLALADTLAGRALELIRSDESASAWLDRLAFLRRSLPEEPWPSFDEPALAELIRLVCLGKRTVDEVRRVPLVPILKGQLTHAQQVLLDAEAPETIVVPSGNRIRVCYQPDGPPSMSVRLQELFGWTDTPRLARGRATVLLHLLGPNFRPVQITNDLRSFWDTTYFQVRKDLRSRYPKHAWPENPLTAKAESKGGRKQS
jgi:ATP-dependent RNA helicase HrpB